MIELSLCCGSAFSVMRSSRYSDMSKVKYQGNIFIFEAENCRYGCIRESQTHHF